VRRAALVVLAALLAAGCGGGSNGSRTAVIAVDAPFSTDPYVASTIANGVRLAAQAHGNRSGDYTSFKVVTYDNAGSPSRAVADVRRAIADHAAAIVTDGTGVDAGWRVAAKADLPMGIVYDGDERLVDPKARPNVFRIAPTNHGMAFRLAEYLVPKHVKLAFLTDDTGYGRAGLSSLNRAFSENRSSVVARVEIPSSATDLAPQVLQARRSGATGLLVWGRPASIAEAVTAARSSGWKVPIYAPPAAEDPLVRQELASRPSWLDGLTFVTGRLTAEGGVAPWYDFQTSYSASFGTEKVGVKDAQGRPVIQPPEFAMYAFDFTNLLAAAVNRALTSHGPQVIRQLNQVSVQGANGDSRGFNEASHEGVVDDDVYFARFNGMVFRPVTDDALSKTLPPIVQHQ
jgi:branched-chain amino acid transport system substrate-binding protein